MSLTNDEREEIKEIYDFGYFMDGVLKYKRDAGSNKLTDEEILLLIEAGDNLDIFSNYSYKSSPCELCGSHGNISVDIENKTFIVKEW